MKHILLSLIFCFLFSGAIQAQHVNLGVKGGLNSYTIESDNNTDYKSKIGFNIGLLGHIHLSSNFAFQPEILYSVQGTKYKIGSTDNTIDLNYVNIPLILQYMFDNGFRIQAGPQLGILTSANFDNGNIDSDIKDKYESTDIGIIVGLSYVKPSTGLGIDLRYNHGLTNINSANSNDSFNRGIQLGLFYLFNHRS